MSETETKTDLLHPSFKTKTVYYLDCTFCLANLCSRGMKAILLADTSIEMFSTDYPFQLAIDTVGESYSTSQCKCKVKDAACVQCGNVVGYHVSAPCRKCLLSSNNGHFWMFTSDTVLPSARLNASGDDIQQWGTLPAFMEGGCINFNFMEECLR